MRLTQALAFRGKRVYGDIRDKLKFYKWKFKDQRFLIDRMRVPAKILSHPDESLVANLRSAIETYHEMPYSKSDRELYAQEWHARHQAQLKERISKHFPQLIQSSPYMHERAVLVHKNSMRFSFGLDQAALLCRAELKQGNPYEAWHEKLAQSSLVQSLRPEVERAVLYAHVWDTEETKLPRRFRTDMGNWRCMRAEWGIHPDQATRRLGQSLFKLVDRHLPIGASRLLLDQAVSASYQYGQLDHRIHFMHQHAVAAMGETKTPLFAPGVQPLNGAETASWLEAKRKPLGPMEPTIDLVLAHNYDKEQFDAWQDDYQPSAPHTRSFLLNYPLPNRWSDFTEPEVDAPTVSQRQSVAVMQAFAQCLATARRLHGQQFVERAMRGDGPDLPKPIAVEAIGSDGVFFDFACFELHTLNFSSPLSPGLCNRVWVDGDVALFKKILPKGRTELKFTKYRDLDMHVFARIFASLARGHSLDNLVDSGNENKANFST